MAQFRVDKITFLVTSPYQPGDVLQLDDCNVLNALRASRIRNSLYRKIIDTLSSDLDSHGDPTESAVRAAQGLVAKFDLDYTLRASPRANSGLDPLEAEILAIARAESIEEFGIEVGDEVIAGKMVDPDVVNRAKARLIERSTVARDSLEELLG
jgi:hypothetical protein